MLGCSLNLNVGKFLQTYASFSLSFCLQFVPGTANALNLGPLVLLSCWQLCEPALSCWGSVFQVMCGTFVPVLFCCFLLKALYLQPLIGAVLSAEDRRLLAFAPLQSWSGLGWKGSESSCIFSSAGWSPAVNWDNEGSHKMYFCFYSSETDLWELIRFFLSLKTWTNLMV